MTAVFIEHRESVRSGHLGPSWVHDYNIFIGKFIVRSFSTHGSMSEGYWGGSAKTYSRKYAELVAKEIGCKVYNVEGK